MPCPKPVNLFADQPKDGVRPGADVPGYTGYVPRKVPEAFYGETFRSCNSKASVAEKSLPAPIRPCTRQNGSPRLRRLAAGGAGAYAPKSYAARFFSLDSSQQQGPVETTVRTTSDEPATPARSPAPSPAPSPTSRARSPLSPGRAVPGYQGYVPGVAAENFYGQSFRRTNERATFAEPTQEQLSVGDGGNKWTAKTSGSGKGLEIRGNIGQVPRKKRSDAPRSGGVNAALHADPEVPMRRSLSCRDMPPGCEIPGYSGHVPRKVEHFGINFKMANEAGRAAHSKAQSLQVPSGPPETEAEAPSGPGSASQGSRAPARSLSPGRESHPDSPYRKTRAFPSGRESTGEIPSHIEHVPRKALSGVSSEKELPKGYPKGRTATGEIPSHINHVPRKCRSLRNLQCFSPDDAAPAQPQPPPAPVGVEEKRPEQSKSPIPGYGGYVPKVGPRNVFGLRYKAANDRAANGDAPAAVPDESARSSSTIECRQGIPGYSGYIPKKGPANIMGATYRTAAERAARGCDPVNEATTEAARLQGGYTAWESWAFSPPQIYDQLDTSARSGDGVRARSPSTSCAPAGMIVGDPRSVDAEGHVGSLLGAGPLPAEPTARPELRPAWR